MAFQQPQRQPAARPVSFSEPAHSPIFTAPPPSVQLDQQEWVLFSPAARTHTTSTERTRTAGRSRLSDFGSLDTAARSEQADPAPVNDDNETEDLDSLDDGLHDFNEPSSSHRQPHVVEQSSQTILPNHDGLGTFPLDSSPVQDRFWQFERYNPRRVRHTRRRSSLSRRIDAAELDAGSRAEDEKLQRIEQWRMDQSRALLEEVEKETRRLRRQSRHSPVKTSRPLSRGSIDIPAIVLPATEPLQTHPQPTESFWQRITRRVIRDLMGFDEETLSMIFGESVAPATSQSAPAVMSPIAQAINSAKSGDHDFYTSDPSTWEGKLLERIAKELGVLVHQLSEHPGAFSTYLRTQETFDYAGLPTPAAFSSNSRYRTSSAHPFTAGGPHFRPTLPRQHRHSLATADPSLWGIEEEEEPSASAEDVNLQREREYWEKDLDVKMVFGYFKNRFGQSQTSQPASMLPPPPQITRPATTTAAADVGSSSNATPESLRRAALIRHHHPLVSSARRNSIMQQAQTRPPPSPILGRRMSTASSCASQSSKRSKIARSGSSRNYWDIGAGSVGSVGWGEV